MCIKIVESYFITSKSICLYVFMLVLCLSCVRNLDIGSDKYTFELSEIINNPISITPHTSYYDVDLSNTKKQRIRRQMANAPVLQAIDQQFEDHVENKVIGSSVTLKCEAKGFPMPNITWYKDDVSPVQRTDHAGVLPVIYDVWSLLLDDLVLEDAGKYTCLVCNPAGCAKRVHRLKIITGYPTVFPYIREGYPGNKTVQKYHSATMSCPTVNNTNYFVKWKKLGVNSHVTKEIVNQGGSAIAGDTLTISNAVKDDEGWYMCVTNNTVGRDNATGYLKVTDDIRNLPSNGTAVKNNGISRWLTPMLSTLLIVSLLVVVVVFVKFRKERLMKQRAVDTAREVMFEQWMKVVSVETENGYSPMGTLQMPKVKIEKHRLSDIINKLPNYVPSPESEYILAVDTKWELDRRYLTLGDVLGEGEFGRVVRAETSGASKKYMPSVVAVKMLKEGHSDADMISFVSEVEIMKMIGKHQNIINLVGCCTCDGPFYAVVEYAANGSLRDFLKKRKPRPNEDENSSGDEMLLKQTKLVEFTLQVARGMEYLASRGCIHRDLAARNVLVSADLVLKIADFGLTRDVSDSDYYRKRTAGKLPVRWMSPESLCHNYYTTKSDVWSFGVLTWEILTYGATPFANIPAHFLYNYLRQGKRMERPEKCSEDMYELMKNCCTFNPEDRPTFSEVREKLEVINSSVNKSL